MTTGAARDSLTAMKRLLVLLLVTASALLGGVVNGLGSAEAAPSTIVPGKYRAQTISYGVIPLPESNVRIVGCTMYQDTYGVGPDNLNPWKLKPTKNGMVASTAHDPATLWWGRVDFVKTSYGYKGVVIAYGVPVGDMILRKVRR